MNTSLVSMDDAPGKGAPDASEADLLAEALANYEAGYAREEDNIREGYEDLSFLGNHQRDPLVRAERERDHRPCLTVNRLPQFVRQITGDIRQMRPAIKVVPVDSDADPDTAKVIAGMVRYIENRSMASAVYFQGADGMVQGGRGAWRVETEYAADSTMAQEIRISPIEDGLSVIFDPDAILPGKTDAMFCFVPVDMTRRAFEKNYPGKVSSSFGRNDAALFQGWFTEDTVRVAEYWFKTPVTRLLLIGRGKVIDLTDKTPEEQAIARQMAELGQARGIDIKVEERKSFRVKRAVLSAAEFVEPPADWPGRHLPIILCDGEEIRIGRRVIRHGAIRNARDPQRMYNYYISAQTETVALQPKAPFIGTEKNFEEFADEWENANAENRPFLRYTPDGANHNAAPQRVGPAVSSSGIAEGLSIAVADLQATTGIYNASLGASGNETSGKAITARQREGDTGTYVYVDHFQQALIQTGRVIVDLIPAIYDTTREMRIVGDDGREELMQINKPAGLQVGGQGAYENDVTVGAYDVVVEMGPSYNTRREEARDGMVAFLQAAPNMAPVVLDLIAKQQDWPLADEIGERLEAMLPPQIKAMLDAKKGEGPGGQPALPAPPPPPSPEEQAQMAAVQRQQELDDRKHAIDLERLDLDREKLAAERQKLQAELARAAADVEKARIEASTRVQEAQHGAETAKHAAKGEDASPGQDPRMDHVIAAVQQLDAMVGQIVQALSAPPAPAANDSGPMAAPAPDVAPAPAPAPDFAALAGPDAGGVQPMGLAA